MPPTEDALTAQGYELGVKQRGNFLGLSIELSVADQISKIWVIMRSGTGSECPILYHSGKEPGQPEGAIPQLFGQYP